MPEINVPEHKIDVVVACYECGETLEGRAATRGLEQWLEVRPCQKCLAEAAKDAASEVREELAEQIAELKKDLAATEPELIEAREGN